MRTQSSMLFAVLMAMALSSNVLAQEEAAPAPPSDLVIENLMDRITKLVDVPADTMSAGAAQASSLPVQQHNNPPDPAVEKRDLSSSFSDFGSSIANLGGSIKNSTVSLWHTLTDDHKDEPNPSADIKVFSKRTNRNAPVEPKNRNDPVPVNVVKPNRNAPVVPKPKTTPGTAKIPLTPVRLLPREEAGETERLYKRDDEDEEEEVEEVEQLPLCSEVTPEDSTELWKRITKIASAGSKRELEQLHEEFKRSASYDEESACLINYVDIKKRSKRDLQVRGQLWDHINKVASASSKREIEQLKQEAKRSQLWNEMGKLSGDVRQEEKRQHSIHDDTWTTEVASADAEQEEKRQHSIHLPYQKRVEESTAAEKRSRAGKQPRYVATAKMGNPKKRSLEGRAGVPHAFAKRIVDGSLGSQNATFSGPGLSGVAGNGTVTVTFNSTEVNLALVNGTLVSSAPLAVTSLDAAVDQLNKPEADVEVVAAPAGLDTAIHTEIVEVTQDPHIASLEGVNRATPTFEVKIPTNLAVPAALVNKVKRNHGARGIITKGQK